MSRTIRRVPMGWQHPRDAHGHEIPLYDEDYESATREWKAAFADWEGGTHPAIAGKPKLKAEYGEYWEYERTPDPEQCRPKFQGPADCYQIYETVTEGTPVSPVFETEEQLVLWLIDEGHSETAARRFVASGWAPSALVYVRRDGSTRVEMGIDSCAMLPEETG